MNSQEKQSQEAANIAQEDMLRKEIQEEMRVTGASQSRIAHESGISLTRLNQWLAGKYKGNTAPVAKSLESWIRASRETREQTARGRIPIVPLWMPTPTANRILLALKHAHKLAEIVIIYGGAGLGKTMTAQHYQGDNPNVWIATMTPSTVSVTACLERVAHAVGVNNVPGSASRAENAILSRITASGGLVVIDEAQHLPVYCLDALRSLYDASGIGLAIMGNESVYTQITGGARKAQFAQLFSRLGRRERLVQPAAGDIDALLDAWGVQESKARAVCRNIGGRAGALRGLTKVLRMARLMMGEELGAISATRIEDAWAELGGMA